MKARKASAKKAAKPQVAKAASKKPAAATKAVAERSNRPGQAKRPSAAKPAAAPSSATAPKTAAPAPHPIVNPVAGKVKVQDKSKPHIKAAAATPAAPSKTSASKVASAAKVARAPRTAGASLFEDDIRAMSDDEYMNDAQLEFFRLRLVQMRQEVLQREMDVKERLHEREVFADPADRATAEEEHWLDLRLRERESLLLKKIDDALRRIEAKEYGYCEKTGDPIGIPRLLARPTATVCVDVKGQDERVEAQFRDR
ncbi:MAG: RNA polymerase-binding protein DksA [Solimonas sp.]